MAPGPKAWRHAPSHDPSAAVLRPVVMLLVVNLAARVILALVDVPAFLRRQPAAIGAAVRRDVTIDSLLVVFCSSCLPSGHLTTANAVGDALLLLVAARADFVVTVVGSRVIVLVVVDRMAQIILLPVYLLAFLWRKPATVRSAVVMNLAVQVRLATLQISGFSGIELP